MIKTKWIKLIINTKIRKENRMTEAVNNKLLRDLTKGDKALILDRDDKWFNIVKECTVESVDIRDDDSLVIQLQNYSVIVVSPYYSKKDFAYLHNVSLGLFITTSTEQLSTWVNKTMIEHSKAQIKLAEEYKKKYNI